MSKKYGHEAFSAPNGEPGKGTDPSVEKLTSPFTIIRRLVVPDLKTQEITQRSISQAVLDKGVEGARIKQPGAIYLPILSPSQLKNIARYAKSARVKDTDGIAYDTVTRVQQSLRERVPSSITAVVKKIFFTMTGYDGLGIFPKIASPHILTDKTEAGDKLRSMGLEYEQRRLGANAHLTLTEFQDFPSGQELPLARPSGSGFAPGNELTFGLPEILDLRQDREEGFFTPR